MIYLGLGSNQGDRRDFLARTLAQLAQGGFEISRVSPIVESPAWLKRDALPEWDRPYLNLVVEGQTRHTPKEMLRLVKIIERALGRDLGASRWSPRNMDIDLLLWNDERIHTPDLKIPHIEMHKRSFVITPLMHLVPHLIIPGINLSPFQISRNIRPIPIWMGVANITPDSFSGEGQVQSLADLETQFETWIEAGVQILDIGGESTRPRADPLTAGDEWNRLQAVFAVLAALRAKHALMPLISVDTRHAEVAQKALENGASWVNDVTGFSDPKMLSLVREQEANVVAMHSLSIPVQPGEVLDSARPVDQQLLEWLDTQCARWQNAGLDMGKIIFDPGVGFGKTALQNQNIIKKTASLRQHGFRLLVGHSRKSFMNGFTDQVFADRDIETLGLSLAMCEQGVDIIRVHDPLSHMRAYRAWAQIRA